MDTQLLSSPPRPICVLSVGRSGSSLVTRALNLLGVHLGAEDDLLPAHRVNELGFWENAAILSLNEQLLELLGGSWYEPPALTAGWERDPRLSELRERAGSVVAELAAVEAPRWGFKDPRTVVLLAFWRAVVGEMDYVICVRRAQAVISSVESLGTWPAEPAATARLWLDVNALSLAQTAGTQRTFIFYEDWFEDARRVTDQLAAFVSDGAATADPAVHESLANFLRSDLRRAEAHELPAAQAAPELDAMYEHLRLAAAASDPERRLHDAQARIGKALAEGYRDREGLCEELGRSRYWLEAIQSSTSWRITAPLRAAKRRLRLRDGI